MKTYLYRASNLKSTIIFVALFHRGSLFLAPSKKSLLRFIHNHYHHKLLQTGFLGGY